MLFRSKQQKFMVEAAEKNDRIDVERERIAAQKEIAGLQVGAKLATDKANLSAKQQEAGLRVGVEIARSAQQSDQQAALAMRTQEPKKPPVSKVEPKESR